MAPPVDERPDLPAPKMPAAARPAAKPPVLEVVDLPAPRDVTDLPAPKMDSIGLDLDAPEADDLNEQLAPKRPAPKWMIRVARVDGHGGCSLLKPKTL